MNKFLKRTLALISIVFSFFCITPAPRVFSDGFISDSMEVSIGRQYDDEIIRQNGGIWQNPEVQNYVEEIGQRLAEVSERTNIPYHFTVLNSGDFNAHSLPGGYVYINRGALTNLQNESQLACVLGHEIAHISKRHGIKMLEQNFAFDFILSIIGWVGGSESQDDAKRIQDITQAGSFLFQLAQLGYGREKELEADRLGAEYAAKIGYDPAAMFELLKMLEEKEGAGQPEFMEIFQTHPAPSKRIEHIQAYLNELYPSGTAAASKDKTYTQRYASKLEMSGDKNSAFYYYDLGNRFEEKEMLDIALVEFRQALNYSPDFADGYDALGRILLKQSRYDEAILQFKNAIKQDKQALYYNDLGSVYYYKGDFEKAIFYFEEAVKIYPEYSLAIANMAENYRCKGDYVKATGLSEKAVRLDPDNFFAHLILANIYETRSWKEDAAREYRILLNSDNYRAIAEERLKIPEEI